MRLTPLTHLPENDHFLTRARKIREKITKNKQYLCNAAASLHHYRRGWPEIQTGSCDAERGVAESSLQSRGKSSQVLFYPEKIITVRLNFEISILKFLSYKMPSRKKIGGLNIMQEIGSTLSTGADDPYRHPV